MKNPKSPCRDRSRGFIGINSPACRFTADQADFFVLNKMIKAADRI